MTWKPISTAPKDGTKVDLFVQAIYPLGRKPDNGAKDENEMSVRSPDSTWAQEAEDSEFMWLDQYGNRVEDEFHGGAYVATHWMIPPEPPND